jgi:sec-independent protein translocase protein TatB
MLANVGWAEMVVLVVVGLVILGPERLPGAIRWSTNALRQARDYLSATTSQLREEMGPEFDSLREPLNQLHNLRGMSPRAVLTKHLLDGDDSLLTGEFDRPGPSVPVDAGPKRAPDPIPKRPPSSSGSTPFDTEAT